MTERSTTPDQRTLIERLRFLSNGFFEGSETEIVMQQAADELERLSERAPEYNGGRLTVTCIKCGCNTTVALKHAAPQGTRNDLETTASRVAPAGAAPCVTVPFEPTEAMLEAARQLDSFPEGEDRRMFLYEAARDVWKAMFAAAGESERKDK